MRIEVKLPKWPERFAEGKAELINDSGEVLLAYRVLGRSDNRRAASVGNPTRDPLRRFGDIPAGEYLARVEPREMLPRRTYGPYRPIRLIPVGGPALEALRNGRSGLLQHSGSPTATGALRPTFGCVRCYDADQLALLALLDAAGITELPYTITEV
jgi:hypothetical protein